MLVIKWFSFWIVYELKYLIRIFHSLTFYIKIMHNELQRSYKSYNCHQRHFGLVSSEEMNLRKCKAHIERCENKIVWYIFFKSKLILHFKIIYACIKGPIGARTHSSYRHNSFTCIKKKNNWTKNSIYDGAEETDWKTECPTPWRLITSKAAITHTLTIYCLLYKHILDGISFKGCVASLIFLQKILPFIQRTFHYDDKKDLKNLKINETFYSNTCRNTVDYK